jgi:DNA repair exonuclease SbcCD ATPase subunit
MIEEKTLQLIPGDVLLLYTDGVIEAAKPEGDDFSVERLLVSTKKLANETCQNITKSIEEEVKNFISCPQEDDITLLCIKAYNIVPKPMTSTVKKYLREAEAFIVEPDLSLDKTAQCQILELERKIADLEGQLKQSEKEKNEIQQKNSDLAQQLEMAIHDPDSFIAELKNRLEISLQLPKDLIAENQRLHDEIAKNKKEMSLLEAEFNHLVSHLDMVQKEKKVLEQDKESLQKLRETCQRAIEKEIEKSIFPFHQKLLDNFSKKNYLSALKILETQIALSLDQGNQAVASALYQQYSFLARLFSKYLEFFLL